MDRPCYNVILWGEQNKQRISGGAYRPQFCRACTFWVTANAIKIRFGEVGTHMQPRAPHYWDKKWSNWSFFN